MKKQPLPIMVGGCLYKFFTIPIIADMDLRENSKTVPIYCNSVPLFCPVLLFGIKVCFLQMLLNNTGDNANRHTAFFVEFGYGKAHIILLPGSSVVIAGVSNRINAVN